MNKKTATKCLHSGYYPKNGEPRAIPIYQSTTYKYDSSDEMGKLFDLEENGYFYSRLANPTCDMVAAKICELEGGVGATLTSSGQAANFFAVFNICENGDHIIASSAIYGGTYNLFSVTMKKMGVEVTFIPPTSTKDYIISQAKPNTKAVFAESISNPALVVLDTEVFSSAAHEIGVPLIVDNTFPTPVNFRPFEHGADIVTHSTTKYMDGKAVSLGGAVVDSGHFDWSLYPDKYPGLCKPDDSYHGIVYTEKFGKMAYMTKINVQLMRDLGSVQSPQNAFLLGLGLETLDVRMKRHCSNAYKIARYLENNDKIDWINYPDLESSEFYHLIKKYMPNGSCGVISFSVKGGRDAAVRFMDSLKIASIVTHVADSKTCVLCPASTTHRQMTDGQLRECGIDPGMVRLSVGIEDADDIISDIQNALDNI